MAYLVRNIDIDLLVWKNTSGHKPLLIRGARQVGKSSSIRHLGESFKHYVEINFEKQPELKDLFKQHTDVKLLVANLSKLSGTPIVAGETLLFMDEIQACPEALKSLWFFKEDYPELHVAAAGSLLEFAINDMPSFGVGRVRSMFMYPLSFKEFLLALGKESWIDAINEADCSNPLLEALHQELVKTFRIFLLIGGMPASVMAWINHHDFQACADELEDIQQSYYDDFAKYARDVEPRLLRSTLQSVVTQSGGKFMYSKVGEGYRTEEVKRALSMLANAGIIKEVRHTSANGLPLGAGVNEKFCKYLYLDTGLLLRILELDFGGSEDVTELILAGTAADLVNKGSLAEMAVGWELVKAASPRTQHELFYWENLDKGTTSEVDYIVMRDMKIVPIEVKSGTSGRMKSLRLFMQKRNISTAIRTSLENFGKLEFEDEDIKRYIDIIPLYAVSKIK